MKIDLIRHGKTVGNLLGRYIGKTDEPLCPEGKEELAALWKGVAFWPEELYTSSLLRTRETAALIFPGMTFQERDAFDECDFGEFENKNYKELSENATYQAWVDSGGLLPFPGGESREAFGKRNREGFLLTVQELLEKRVRSAAFVIHGGSIMSILEAFGTPHHDFYHWQAKNGHGFSAFLDEESWLSGNRILTEIRSIPSL